MNKEEGKDWCSPFIPHTLTQLKNYFLTLVCVNNINKTCYSFPSFLAISLSLFLRSLFSRGSFKIWEILTFSLRLRVTPQQTQCLTSSENHFAASTCYPLKILDWCFSTSTLWHLGWIILCWVLRVVLHILECLAAALGSPHNSTPWIVTIKNVPRHHQMSPSRRQNHPQSSTFIVHPNS